MTKSKESNAKDNSTNQSEANLQASKDLQKIRAIINEKAFEQERQVRQAKAREELSQLFTEALNDRQERDGSVGHIISPLVQQSMQKSMSVYRDQFTDYLYPLVGDLARKFTLQILRDFIEKTNEVIENTVSFKSLYWRLKAWRAGVSYRQFVASQTFVFQIKQVLLIHKKTGLLLNSVSEDIREDENSSLVSAMLTAINDFVSDSFSSQNSGSQQQLDEIKTKDFTLYIKQGPQAMLVAAVSGVISPKAKFKLQKTLEQIHRLYRPQLNAFDGNTEAFYSTRDYLHECLLSEQKAHAAKKKNSPIFAGLLFVCILALFLYWSFLSYSTHQAKSAIEQLQQSQGISINRIDVEGIKDIRLSVFRDPRAPSIAEWLSPTNIDSSWLNIQEISFVSMSSELMTQDKPMQESTINEIALNSIAGEISQLQVNFELASAKLESSELAKLKILAKKYQQLKTYANANNQIAKLLILGTSDNIGDPSVNQQLSIERALNTKNALSQFGIDDADMMVSGLGSINVTDSATNIRKTIINIVYNPR